MNQTKAVELFLSSPRGLIYRYVGKSWFVYSDEYWVLDEGNIRITQAINAVIDDMNWRTGGMRYMVDRIRTELRWRLKDDRLPGRLDLSIPGPSEPQAP